MNRNRWLVRTGVAALLVAGIVTGSFLWVFGGDTRPVDGARVGSAIAIVEGGFVATYALDTGDGGVVLVDSGADPEATAIRAWLAGRGLGAEHVRAILVTHGHGDHVGGCGAFPDAEVVARTPEKGLIEGTEGAHGPVTSWSRNDGSCRVDRTVADGESVTFGSLVATAYAVPGHTAGSAAWLVDGVLFLGDAASASKRGEATAPKWVFSDDQQQGLRSLAALGARLEHTQVRWLAFGHTGPLDGLEPLRRVEP